MKTSMLKLFELRRFRTDDERQAALARLDERLSRDFAAFLGNMRGAFIKVAQVLGSLDPPPVRPAYVGRIANMTDAAPGGRPWRTIERHVERECRRLGRGGLADVFSEFERAPLGTASVGQVHRAVLREDGREVAVKIQYRDARRLILTDLGNIHRVLRVLGKRAEASVVREYRGRMSQEFDFLAEGRTMDALDVLLRAQGEQIFRLGTFNADPHPGNVLLTRDRTLALIDFGCSKTLSAAQRVRLARLYVALAARDREATVEAAIAMGVRTAHMDRQVIHTFVTHFFDRNIAQESPAALLIRLNGADRLSSLPREYMLVARSSLLLRGVGARLHAPVECARMWESEARTFLKSPEAAAALASMSDREREPATI